MIGQHCTDLKKVTHAEFFWRNQLGQKVSRKPRKPSVNGQVFEPDALLYRGHGEGMLSYAKRKGLLDKWTPVVKLYCSMARVIVYEGRRAQSIWREWTAKNYKKPNAKSSHSRD